MRTPEPTRPRSAALLRFIALASASAIALAACSASPPTTDSTTDSDAGTSSLKSLTFINPAPAQAAWQIVAKCFTDAANAAGITPKVVGSPGANTTTSEQLTFIEQAIAEGADGIVAASYAGASALEGAFQTARDEGILVATVQSGQATQARNFDVGLDIVSFGKDAANQIASVPGNHEVALLLPGLAGTPKFFEEAFVSEIAQHSNVTLVQTISDDGAVDRDADLVSSLLIAHPEITDIVAVNPGSIAGVVTAIKEANALGKTFLLGNSLTDPAPDALAEGVASAFYAQKRCDIGTLAVQNMVAISEGETVPSEIPVETQFVTKDTLSGLDLSLWY